MTPLYSLLVDLLSLTYKTQLTLQKLVLRGCGGNLKGLDVMNLINSTDSPLKFSQHQSAVLLFLHISTLPINEVNITFYLLLWFCCICHQPIKWINQSFWDFHFIWWKTWHESFWFQYISFFTDSLSESLSDLMKLNIEYLPVANAAGLTILCTQKIFTAEVYVSQSIFISNNGPLTGAVLVMYF